MNGGLDLQTLSILAAHAIRCRREGDVILNRCVTVAIVTVGIESGKM